MDEIYINEDTYHEDINIEPQESHTKHQEYNWKDNRKYKITIGTTTGLTVEKTKKSPKSGN